MDANISCEIILKHLKSSNLNFVLQETPYSAYITIRKSFVKTRDSVIPESTAESGEVLYDKIKVLQAENVSLKTDLHKLKSLAKKSDDEILDLEVQLKNSQDKALENGDDAKKVNKQKAQLENVVSEKEKEIVKLKNIAKTLQTDNSVVRNNLQNVTKTLKLTEKEKFRAQMKCENLEETVKKLKEEKVDLQKSLKKLQKTQKTKLFKNNNPPLKEPSEIIDTAVPEAKIIELKINEKDTDTIAYNIAVENPFETLAIRTLENETNDANDVTEVETVENKDDPEYIKENFDNVFLKAFQDCL